jgi:hypothetical protein
MFAVGVGVTCQPATGCPDGFIDGDVLIFWSSRLLSSDVGSGMVPTQIISLDNLYLNSCFLTRSTMKKCAPSFESVCQNTLQGQAHWPLQSGGSVC